MSLLSIPVWLMEPLSTLQKMSEITEFMHCLAKADDSDDESVRCAMVAAFACGAYASIKRTYKPFNPILGETFEVALPDGAVYLAEQVRARRWGCAECETRGRKRTVKRARAPRNHDLAAAAAHTITRGRINKTVRAAQGINGVKRQAPRRRLS